jgi:predicted enzyme related to lactoylglutathione lyase
MEQMMGDFNSKYNRAVWFDIPVVDLDRAAAFYSAVLGIGVRKESFGDFTFCVLDHQNGNGGCLVKDEAEISAGGVLLYLNVDGRIQDAVSKGAAWRHGY